MPILEAVFEWLVEMIFEVFLDLLLELAKKLFLGTLWVARSLARLLFRPGLRREPVYFQRGKSLREPAQRGLVFSPTRRRR